LPYKRDHSKKAATTSVTNLLDIKIVCEVGTNDTHFPRWLCELPDNNIVCELLRTCIHTYPYVHTFFVTKENYQCYFIRIQSTIVTRLKTKKQILIK